MLVGPATFDVPAPTTGRLAEIRGREDDRVAPGAVLGLVAATEDGDGDDRETSAGPPPDMTTIQERSAGVIPYRLDGDRGLVYLVLHSATVRNPRAKWEFPKGGMEAGETTRETAAREFQEETGLVRLVVPRRLRAEPVLHLHPPRPQGHQDASPTTSSRSATSPPSTRSAEHVEDPFGHWCHWGTFDQITRLLYHAKIRQVFAEADEWLRNGQAERSLPPLT